MTAFTVNAEVDRSRRPKGKAHPCARALVVACALTLVTARSPASATVERPPPTLIDLPLAGLRIVPRLAAGTTVTVSSRWHAEHAEDRVVVIAPQATPVAYAIEVGGRTARDCPLDDPFPIELDGETWIRAGRSSDPAEIHTLICRTFSDARVIVRISPPPASDAALASHGPFLAALLDAVRNRTLIPGGPPPLPPPEHTLDPELTLPTVGLVLARPDDRMYWRVAEPAADRDFDALIRALPVFPEVQVAVRRHLTREVADCARVVRHLADNHWSRSEALPPPAWTGMLEKRITRFDSRALCRVHGDALLDVRIASRPRARLDAMTPILDALAHSRIVAPPPPSPLPLAPTRAVLAQSAALALGLDFPGTVPRAATVDPRAGDDAAPYGALELALSWIARNGPALGAALQLGADARGELLGATFEAGVALALDREMTFVFMLAFDERRRALYANRSLSLALELRADLHRPETFAWWLRVVPLQLASREPAITGLPLTIAWTGLFPSGLLVGADMSWVSSPTRPNDAWSAEGLTFGVRIGVGAITR